MLLSGPAELMQSAQHTELLLIEIADPQLVVNLLQLQVDPTVLHSQMLTAWVPEDLPQSLADCQARSAERLPSARCCLSAKAKLFQPGPAWHLQIKVSRV